MSPINPQNTSFYKKNNNNKLVAGNKVKQYPWKRERFINIIFIFWQHSGCKNNRQQGDITLVVTAREITVYAIYKKKTFHNLKSTITSFVKMFL